MIERDKSGYPCRLKVSLGKVVISVVLLTGLFACQSATSPSRNGHQASGSYPSLRSVPTTSRPTLPIEERRRIVQELIEDRKASRRQTAIVRHRSGLRSDPPPPLSNVELSAEDIIGDDPEFGDGAFRLTPEKKAGADSVYRGDTQFEDGSLDDFIRQLKRDTRPSTPATVPTPTDPDQDDVSFFFSEPNASEADMGFGNSRAIWLAAVAPVFDRGQLPERDFAIRLAADGEEPGFFCGYLGWVVAWSSICVDEPEAALDDNNDIGTDFEQSEPPVEESVDSEPPAPASSPASSEARRQRAERQLSEEEVADAIEGAGEGVLAPVTSSLDKLREFIRARREGSAAASQDRVSYRPAGDPVVPAETEDRPPVPDRRPDVLENTTIVDDGETFDFIRTPTPAFKPSREEHAAVILPPSENDAEPPRPATRPSDLVPNQSRPDPESTPKVGDEGTPVTDASRNETALAARIVERLDTEQSPAPKASTLAKLPPPEAKPEAEQAASKEATLDLAGPEDPLEPYVIKFATNSPALPDGVAARLITILANAMSHDQKIHIIGEASTNHLARRRATDVGAVLVQLGATVEILEYDHEARAGVDQVRLVLKPAEPDPLFSTTAPTVIEK